MPSGAKKRKALKKKKEKQANNTTHLGDLQEEKESDGGETNSPMSQDHNNNQHFSEEREDTSSIQSAVTESGSVEGVNRNGDTSDNVAYEGKDTVQAEPDTVTIEHTEHEKKSSSSSSSSRSSSSSSSSDDESKFADKNIQVINWEESIYSPSLSAEVDAVINSEEISDLPEATRVNEVTLHNLDVVTPVEESYEAVPVLDDDFVVEKSKVEVSDSVAETIPQVEPVIVSKEEVQLSDKSEYLGVPSTVVDMGSQSNGDAISSKATEDGEVITIPIEEVSSKTLPQSNVPAVDTVSGTEQKKVSEIESLDKQTPVVPPPRPVQTTSSMGCCGLFELFKGSNR